MQFSRTKGVILSDLTLPNSICLYIDPTYPNISELLTMVSSTSGIESCQNISSYLFSCTKRPKTACQLLLNNHICLKM